MSTCTSNGLLKKVYIHGLQQQLVPFIFREELYPAAGILVEVEMPARRRDGDLELKVPDK
jgi:hypothetical protein